MRTATIEFLENRGDPTSVDLASLNSALSWAPLEDEPYTFAAAQQFGSGDPERVEALLKVALHRNPRSREARVYLLEHLVDQGRAREAIEQIEILSLLMPDRRGLFQSNLLYLVTFPDTRPEAIAALTDNTIRLNLMRSLANAGASASMILDTHDAFEDFDLGADPSASISSWIAPLIERSDYNGALRVWRRFNPEAKAGALLVDNKFSGRFGPPFGWTIRSGPNGYAKLGDAGLTGEYYGRRPASLAQQVLLLSPGAYKISFSDLASVGPLKFVIRCLGGQELANDGIEQKLATTFSVPTSGCDAQTIEISGRPTDPPRSVQFGIGNVALERLDQ
ncbi:tetratricopeptide repeat protein [Altererythrobacter sp. GH1-8]|uniref:tetratricopeptide repeat protein n=1 Tax=Altererythrobacter sp. GH1-8 TaxID=3349333 RepID=UPI00374DB6B1